MATHALKGSERQPLKVRDLSARPILPSGSKLVYCCEFVTLIPCVNMSTNSIAAVNDRHISGARISSGDTCNLDSSLASTTSIAQGGIINQHFHEEQTNETSQVVHDTYNDGCRLRHGNGIERIGVRELPEFVVGRGRRVCARRSDK